MDTRRTMSLTPIDAAIRFERMSFQQDCAAITADDADAALMYNIQATIACLKLAAQREGRAS